MARSHRTFVSYIDKSREFYAAQGYDQPYRWAANADSPFAKLTKPLSECTVGIVTTSRLPDHDVLAPYAAPSDPQPDAMDTAHLSWHKAATHTNDLGSFLPLDHLRELADEGIIGRAAPRFVGIPTIYSQRRTNTWAQTVLEELEHDGVDLALLIPL